MAYSFPHKTRMKREEVIGQMASGSCAAGTITFNVNLPAGSWAIGFSLMGVANDKPFVATVAPWVDHEQTVLSSTSYKFLKTGGTTATTILSVASTSTKLGHTGVLIPAGDQYGAAAPVIVVHGAQITIASTATTGTWELAYTAVEI